MKLFNKFGHPPFQKIKVIYTLKPRLQGSLFLECNEKVLHLNLLNCAVKLIIRKEIDNQVGSGKKYL